MSVLKYWDAVSSSWKPVGLAPVTELIGAKSRYVPNTNPDITATAWAPLPTNPCVVTLDAPLPVGTPVLITFHAWLVCTTTVAGDVRAAIQCSGGAVLAAGSPVGHTLYNLAGGVTTRQGGMALVVTITDDTVPLTVEMYAQQAGRAAANQRAVNYPGISVVPLQPPVIGAGGEVDTGWVDVPVRSGFAWQSGTPAQVRRIGKVVHSRWGFSNTGIAAVNTAYVVADIPAGFRPAQSVYFRAGTQQGSISAGMVVNPNGTVEVRSGPTLGNYYLFPNTTWLVD